MKRCTGKLSGVDKPGPAIVPFKFPRTFVFIEVTFVSLVFTIDNEITKFDRA